MSVRMVPRRTTGDSRRIRWTRHSLQGLVVAFVAFLVWAKAARPGSASAEAFCPFGGFETVFTWATTGHTVSHVHPANLVLAAVVVVLTLTARGAFCGWLCPLGAIQEGIYAAGDAVVRRVPALRKARRRIGAEGTWLARVDHVARYGRYVVLAWAVGGAAVTGIMVFRAYDPWAALISVVEFEITTAFVVLLAMLVAAVFVERPFCRYACPLGAVIGIIGKASPVAVQRNADACLGCDLCSKACPMGIPVDTKTRVTDAQCIGCLECVAACPSRDALSLTISLPFPARPPTALAVPAIDAAAAPTTQPAADDLVAAVLEGARR